MSTTNQAFIFQWAILRLTVAYAGQTQPIGWWLADETPSESAFDSTQSSFVKRLFPRSYHTATLGAVCDSLRTFHDSRIGSQQVFHLFRLPPEWEHKIHEMMLRNPGFWQNSAVQQLLEASNPTVAVAASIATLKGDATFEHGMSAGPIKMGDDDLLAASEAPAQLAALYEKAIEQNVLTMPYYTRNASTMESIS